MELLAESEFSIANFGTEASYRSARPVILAAGTVHYSVYKIADVLGIGRKNILHVDVDERFRMDVNRLEETLHRTIGQGMLPLAVIGIAGTTEEGAINPLTALSRFAKGWRRLPGTVSGFTWMLPGRLFPIPVRERGRDGWGGLRRRVRRGGK